MRNDWDQPEGCGDITVQRSGQMDEGKAYLPISSSGAFRPGELKISTVFGWIRVPYLEVWQTNLSLIFTYRLKHILLPSWHMMFIQCRLNVDATSWRCIDVAKTYKRHVSAVYIIRSSISYLDGTSALELISLSSVWSSSLSVLSTFLNSCNDCALNLPPTPCLFKAARSSSSISWLFWQSLP